MPHEGPVYDHTIFIFLAWFWPSHLPSPWARPWLRPSALQNGQIPVSLASQVLKPLALATQACKLAAQIVWAQCG